MEHEVTERYGYLWAYLNIIIVNATIKYPFDATILMVKVDNNFGGVVVHQKEPNCTWRYNLRVNVWSVGVWVSRSAWFQFILDLF